MNKNINVKKLTVEIAENIANVVGLKKNEKQEKEKNLNTKESTLYKWSKEIKDK